MRLEPYPFIRSVTFAMATFWTLRSLWRSLRFVERWQRRLGPLGIERAWLWRQVLTMMLRASLLDPVNLALLLALVSVWVA